MNTFSHVWVFSDTPSRLPELMSGALASGEQIHAFVQHDAEGETARQLGANHIWHLRGKPDDCMVEDYAGGDGADDSPAGGFGSGAAA
ncbi:putative electron transfer flavoprotein FixB [Citrobacter koseri]|nr:putative electron transfer flavoprotein FixB [Citrobacter koseri]